jgi:hypothetical protein
VTAKYAHRKLTEFLDSAHFARSKAMTQRKRPYTWIVEYLLVFCIVICAGPAVWAGEYVFTPIDQATCDQGATSGRDYTGNFSSDWYFIGTKPPCPNASSLKKYCTRIQTQDGYLFEATVERMNSDSAWLKEMIAPLEGDDEAKAETIARFPKQSLQKSLQKCGLTGKQVRAKLLAEAEAATKTDAVTNTDFAVIGTWAPDLAMKIWKRECEGHPFTDPADHSESPRTDKYWKSNPRFLNFCLVTTEDRLSARPKNFKGLWKDSSDVRSPSDE